MDGHRTGVPQGPGEQNPAYRPARCATVAMTRCSVIRGTTGPPRPRRVPSIQGVMMQLLRTTVRGLRRRIADGSLVHHLTEQFAYQRGCQPGPREIASWAASLPALCDLFVDVGL